jgi:hypothetical protein
VGEVKGRGYSKVEGTLRNLTVDRQLRPIQSRDGKNEAKSQKCSSRDLRTVIIVLSYAVL